MVYWSNKMQRNNRANGGLGKNADYGTHCVLVENYTDIQMDLIS